MRKFAEKKGRAVIISLIAGLIFSLLLTSGILMLVLGCCFLISESTKSWSSPLMLGGAVLTIGAGILATFAAPKKKEKFKSAHQAETRKMIITAAHKTPTLAK